MPTVFVTGAARGIGLEFTKRYLLQGWNVIAAARKPSAELKSLKARVVEFDVTDTLGGSFSMPDVGAIDVLINCAGVYGATQEFGSMDYQSYLDTQRVNVLAPLRISELLLPNLMQTERRLIVNITSMMGSISGNTSGGSYTYRASKAALNAVSMSLAQDLHTRKVSVLLLHPGWVKTDMGGPNAQITTEESVTKMMKVIADYKGTGKFLTFEGKPVGW